MKLEVPEGRMNIGDIDPFMCTHLIYAFGVINVDSLTIEGTYVQKYMRLQVWMPVPHSG